jgi:hypothetical protein
VVDMAIQKKKQKKRVKKSEVFNWNARRKLVAQLMSTGLKTQREIAEEVHVTDRKISEWKQYPEFIKEVERLTFLQENATRAGVVRQALKALDIKEKFISEDRSTFLDYLEFIIKIIPSDTKEDDDKLNELIEAIKNSARMIGK